MVKRERNDRLKASSDLKGKRETAGQTKSVDLA